MSKTEKNEEWRGDCDERGRGQVVREEDCGEDEGRMAVKRLHRDHSQHQKEYCPRHVGPKSFFRLPFWKWFNHNRS